MKRRIFIFLCLCAALILSACAGNTQAGAPPAAAGSPTSSISPADDTVPSSQGYERTPPDVIMPQFGGGNQQSNSQNGISAVLDMSFINDGYVGVQLNGSEKAKFRVQKDDTGDFVNYELDIDGTTNFFPVTWGDGAYSFVVYTFAYTDADGKPYYNQFLTGQAQAALTSEFVPFLIPTKLARYTPDSDCVQGSYPITRQCATDAEVVEAIYAWIAGNIDYDTAKAEAIGGKPGTYEPYPDDTYNTGLGICYDYASLTTAMMRANGIPTKLIKGEVLLPEGGSIVHAWNMVWIEGEGWIALNLPVSPEEWNRIDTTFAAGGAGEYVGDGENYTVISEH